ncbi:uncharacterized protein LOC113533470 [Pangasianodon hypophthalmus]|uniref:uncharacterized protein LOC113533470 n=1 Tax=Pangasianodon hypophthalmus TaxID=310915 RepID=UPI0023076E1F|nr:uncharacterized protein LOC113533470 [Pangasianodon hypophthalmus]
MMAVVMQLVFFLFILVSITASQNVFKLINSSVQLDVQTKGYQFLDFTWTFNKSNNIVKHYKNSPSIVFPDYEERVELNEKTHSLTLKNLQKNDNGLYAATAAFTQNLKVAEYQLYVLDPVEKPVLNVSPQQSNDACIVTLTCEAQKLSITSHCYSDNCDMKEEKMARDAFLSLSLYVSNSFIICNHSNPVSWKYTAVEMQHVKQLCLPEGVSMHTFCMG